MIVSFYDKNFKGMQNNASLVVDNNSYSLIQRGVELDELSCTCEAFIENIQPTFLVVKNDKGNYVYGAFAGIPQIDNKNQTKITATDLKTLLKNDIILQGKNYTNVNEYLNTVFEKVKIDVVQGSFVCELKWNSNVGTIAFDYLTPPESGTEVYNAWDDIFAPFLKYYGLFLLTRIDLVNKKIVFTVGKSMYRAVNVKLWELGIYNYGKWVADVNETQGFTIDSETGTLTAGERWILRSDNTITNDPELRDIYPIKRKVVLNEYTTGTDNGVSNSITALNEANTEALKTLTDSMFNENLELTRIAADFETAFNIYPRRGAGLYKVLPCGELHFDSGGLKKVQVGYRFTGIQFLLRK